MMVWPFFAFFLLCLYVFFPQRWFGEAGHGFPCDLSCSLYSPAVHWINQCQFKYSGLNSAAFTFSSSAWYTALCKNTRAHSESLVLCQFHHSADSSFSTILQWRHNPPSLQASSTLSMNSISTVSLFVVCFWVLQNTLLLQKQHSSHINPNSFAAEILCTFLYRAESILQQSGYDSNPGPLLRVKLALSPGLQQAEITTKNAMLSVFILAGVAGV